MANRLFTRNAKQLGSFSRGIRQLADSDSPQNCRSYSKRSWRTRNTYVEHVLFGHIEKQASTVWPDSLGCLGEKDRRFSLPGNVAVDSSVIVKAEDKPTPERLKADKKIIEDEIAFWRTLNDSPSNYQHQINMLKQHEENEKQIMEDEKAIERKVNLEETVLECVAQECPRLLRLEMAPLFSSLQDGPTTAITVCQKTHNDMSSWSPDVEDEREALLEEFINTAKDLCEELRNRSQWADFIEPTSGRPFYSKYTNLTFFETDERYRLLGFKIEDLGCCKVISHHKWGTHSFVGTIFTSAPHDSEYLQQMIHNCNQKLNPQ